MGQISVTMNGRTYRLRCGDGEEERLLALASHVKSQLESLVVEFGQVGDDRLLLMAALMIADELWDARESLDHLQSTGRTEAPLENRDLPPFDPAGRQRLR